MYQYAATVACVVDGDTVKLDVDLGFSIRQRMTLRLYGINAPEMVGATKVAGEAAKAFLISLLSNGGEVTPGGVVSPAWKPLTITTYKDKGDKYGRILADLYTTGANVPVNQQMIDAGHAVAYYGGARS